MPQSTKKKDKSWITPGVIENWYILGDYFGYPDCCVEAFVKGESVDSEFNGTGFKPCAECAKLPYDLVLGGITRRRKHFENFPDTRLFDKMFNVITKMELTDAA